MGGKSGSSVTVGYWYSLGIHMGVCRGPVDEVVEAQVGGRRAWPPEGSAGATETGDYWIANRELFGGESKEGGIEGTMSVMMGKPDQVAAQNAREVLGPTLPGFRGVLTVFYRGLISALNPYPKKWAFRIRRTHKGWMNDEPWYPETAKIILYADQGALPINPNPGGGQPEPEEEVWDERWPDPETGIQEGQENQDYGQVYGPGIGGETDIWGYPTHSQLWMKARCQALADTYSSMGGEEGFPISMGYGASYHWFNICPLVDYSEQPDPDPGGEPPPPQVDPMEIAAMNPIHIIYECHTNKEWGRGLDPSLIDEAAFRNAADTLYAEKFGMCIKWARKDSVEAFMQTVIDHIGAVIYTDRGSGLRTIKLIRDDYLHSSLPHFDTDSGLLAITEASVSSLGGAINEIITTYRDPVTNEDRNVRIQNLGAMQAEGGSIHSISKTYRGLPTADLAMRVSQRDLRLMSSGLRRFKLQLDRSAWRVSPGDVIRISEPSRGVYDMAVRVGSVKDGTLTNGKIEVVAIQDVFSFPMRSFQGILPPDRPFEKFPFIKRRRVFELPYTWLNANIDRANFQTIDFDAGYAAVVVEKPSDAHQAYDINVNRDPWTPGTPTTGQ